MNIRSLLVSLVLLMTHALAAASWTPVGPPGGAVYGLAVDPKDASILYAGTWGGGIWKSKDGGATWSRLPYENVDETIHGIAVSPQDSRVVLAAGVVGIHRSADGGMTWKTVLDQDHSQPEMTGFAFDPTKPSTVYASSDSDGHPAGVFKSTDSGVTWKAANAGIHQNSRVRSVAVARDGSAVWAASSDGVYQSDDAGGSWKVVLAGRAAHSVVTGEDGIVLAGTNAEGIFRSVDAGKTWSETKSDVRMSGIVYALVASAATKDLFYAGRPNRILRSTDGGATWTTFSRGFNWVNFRSLAIDDKSGAVWGGTGRDGVVKSVDGGKTWTTGTGFLSLQVTSILIDPASPKRIFVGTTQGGVHLSEDGGATWRLWNEGLDDRSVHSFAALASAPGTLMVGTGEGAYRSTDGGANWTHVLKGGCDPETQHLAFAGEKRVWAHSGRDFCQVMRSDDGGLTWKEVKTPRPDSSMRGHFAFYVDPSAPDEIAFSTDRYLHLSTDGGTNWTPATGIPSTSRVQELIAGKNPDELFAATNSGIYRSADKGKTWEPAGKGSEKNDVRRLLLDRSTGTIWAGAWDGILRSSDGGKTWTNVGGALPHPDVVALALEAGKTLLVGFSGGGVYRLSV